MGLFYFAGFFINNIYYSECGFITSYIVYLSQESSQETVRKENLSYGLMKAMLKGHK